MVWVEGHRPMLYDLGTDPDEFIDLGADDKHKGEITRLSAAMFDWSRRQHNRVTLSDEKIDNDMCHDDAVEGGIWAFGTRRSWPLGKQPTTQNLNKKSPRCVLGAFPGDLGNGAAFVELGAFPFFGFHDFT